MKRTNSLRDAPVNRYAVRTLHDVAVQLQMTVEGVRICEKRAFEKLRKKPELRMLAMDLAGLEGKVKP